MIEIFGSGHHHRLLFCVQSGTLIHMVPQLTDRGISLQAASLIVAATAGCGVFGSSPTARW